MLVYCISFPGLKKYQIFCVSQGSEPTSNVPQHISGKCDIPWYAAKKCCITILYYTIENSVAITNKMQHMMGRLSVLLLCLL